MCVGVDVDTDVMCGVVVDTGVMCRVDVDNVGTEVPWCVEWMWEHMYHGVCVLSTFSA